MPYFILFYFIFNNPFFCQEIFRLFTELSGSLSYSYIYIFVFPPRESKELCSLCPLRRVKLLIFTSVRAGHMTYWGRGQTTVEGWVVRWGRENGLIRTIKSLSELTGLWGLKMDVCFRRTLGWISREALFCLFS